MNLSDWLSDKQIERINRHVDAMVQDRIRQTLISILLPVGRTRRQYMGQVNIGQFRQDMIHFFTTQFRNVIFPVVFPDGIPAEFEPSTKIRENIFYAGVSTTVRQMFLRKVLLRLYRTLKDNWDVEHPSIHTVPPTVAGGFKQFIEKEF